MGRTKVRELMTGKVVSAHPDASYKELVELLMRYDVSGIPIVDEDGALMGIVTEADLLTKEAQTGVRRPRLLSVLADALTGKGRAWARKAEGRTARDLMTEDVVTVAPGAELRKAARLMSKHGVKRLPVTDDGKLVGMLSRHDVLEAFDRPDDDIQASVERFLRECVFVAPEAEIDVKVDDGVVTLTGRVHFESDRRVAASLVASVDGVVGVENQLTFREPDPRLQAV